MFLFSSRSTISNFDCSLPECSTNCSVARSTATLLHYKLQITAMRLRQNFLLPSLFVCVCVIILCWLGLFGLLQFMPKTQKFKPVSERFSGYLRNIENKTWPSSYVKCMSGTAVSVRAELPDVVKRKLALLASLSIRQVYRRVHFI